MKKWKIPVAWEMSGVVEIEADTLEEAMEIVETDMSIGLPEGEYIEGSFQLSTYDVDYIREGYNDNQQDESEE